MDRSRTPKQDAWYLKALIVVLGAGLIYAGQLSYEKHLSDREWSNSNKNRKPPRVTVLRQLDFAGKTLAERRKMLAELLPIRDAGPVAAILGSLRGLVGVSLTPTGEDPPFDDELSLNEPSDSFTFEIDSVSSPPIPAYEVSAHLGNYALILITHTSARAIDSPTLCVKDSPSAVQRLSLYRFQPLPTTEIGSFTHAPPISLTKAGLLPDSTYIKSFLRPSPTTFVPRVKPAQYWVRLTQAAPTGERAFVRLVRTEYGTEEEDPAWHELSGARTSFYSPIGPMASKAQVEVIYCRPRKIEVRTQVPIGQISVEFGQPILLRATAESIAITPSLLLKIPDQGLLPKRPSEHPKRAILISGSVVSDGSLERIPDSLIGIRWVAPTPASLGLDAIWFPWGSVYAPAPTSGPIKNGPLTATLQVSYTRWDVIKRQSVVVPLQAAPSAN